TPLAYPLKVYIEEKDPRIRLWAMTKWAELRSQGQFAEEIDPKAFEKEVGIPYSRALGIEEDIMG
ncbi:MAG: hypothetical protein P8P49_10435, partial [Opitutales bacterium]|nr:hypothetical protein [Opitutales bacterium]